MIKDDFKRFQAIWSGAKFSQFVKYWIGAGRREFYYKLAGYRKHSLLGDVGVGDVKFSNVPIRKLNTRDEIDLSGSPELNQGRVGACACVTLCGIVQDEATKQDKDKSLSIDWKFAWKEMKGLELADDKQGSTLQDNLFVGQDEGYYDNKENLWRIDKVQKIKRTQIEKYLRMGYQIYTGDKVCAPMCSKEWIFNTGTPKYGHAFRLIGIKKVNGVDHFLAETTWLNYAYKKEAQFFIKKEDVFGLMNCYVMTVKKV